MVSIPSIAATYNDEMNAVDRGDQMRAYWGPDRRVRRGGWRALAWDFLLEIALINSFILQQRGNPRWKPEKSQAEWRQRLVNDLVAKARMGLEDAEYAKAGAKGRKVHDIGTSPQGIWSDDISTRGTGVIWRCSKGPCRAVDGRGCEDGGVEGAVSLV
ncbi:hypothetical protein FOMA001_g18173 [Fusarium oxysporum f. sp. matthiolae]|nr:hypothetical protein FOMA001_g18173 [Fusarium oxysporum f. sp. matthiolae]